MEEPYVEKHPNGTSYGFSRGKGKEIDEDTLIKYFKKISKNEFLAKQMIHIPTT
jgi:hypothetical protein